MAKISKLFQRKQKNILNIYCTAGYPELNSTLTVMKSLQDNGADMIELGMPYSDPLADGPVIQASSAKALANHVQNQSLLLRQLEKPNKKLSPGGYRVYFAPAAVSEISGLMSWGGCSYAAYKRGRSPFMKLAVTKESW